MEYFVEKKSIVRTIWGKSDTVLFIFAGAAAEFALNKAVDWLYFTGRLPQDPLGRLFSTISYARKIVFSEEQLALKTIDAMSEIHAGVEASRSKKIPEWAYRDVLFMLIDYSIRTYELLENEMSNSEKNEVLQVFTRLGQRMGIEKLPANFEQFVKERESHMQNDLNRSHYTIDLFKHYKKHLGLIRYKTLIEIQTLIVPQTIKNLLGYRKYSFLYPLLLIYKFLRILRINHIMKALILPSDYRKQIMALDT